jgi:hypothetical protein
VTGEIFMEQRNPLLQGGHPLLEVLNVADRTVELVVHTWSSVRIKLAVSSFIARLA